MYLPSQEKALGVLQCLNILEKTGEMPKKKHGPLCLDAHTWSAQRLLHHLTEFFDLEEPMFYQGQNEQNTLLAEETLRELINKDDNLQEIHEILLEYSKELPQAQSYQIVLPENKNYNPKRTNPDYIPNIWKWQNCRLLFVSLDCTLKDPNGVKIQNTINTINESGEDIPEALILYNYKKNCKGQDGCQLSLVDDIWYTLPEKWQFKNLSWVGRNHMCIEQCLEIMEKIRGENELGNLKNISIL